MEKDCFCKIKRLTWNDRLLIETHTSYGAEMTCAEHIKYCPICGKELPKIFDITDVME